MTNSACRKCKILMLKMFALKSSKENRESLCSSKMSRKVFKDYVTSHLEKEKQEVGTCFKKSKNRKKEMNHWIYKAASSAELLFLELPWHFREKRLFLWYAKRSQISFSSGLPGSGNGAAQNLKASRLFTALHFLVFLFRRWTCGQNHEKTECRRKTETSRAGVGIVEIIREALCLQTDTCDQLNKQFTKQMSLVRFHYLDLQVHFFSKDVYSLSIIRLAGFNAPHPLCLPFALAFSFACVEK